MCVGSAQGCRVSNEIVVPFCLHYCRGCAPVALASARVCRCACVRTSARWAIRSTRPVREIADVCYAHRLQQRVACPRWRITRARSPRSTKVIPRPGLSPAPGEQSLIGPILSRRYFLSVSVPRNQMADEGVDESALPLEWKTRVSASTSRGFVSPAALPGSRGLEQRLAFGLHTSPDYSTSRLAPSPTSDYLVNVFSYWYLVRPI